MIISITTYIKKTAGGLYLSSETVYRGFRLPVSIAGARNLHQIKKLLSGVGEVTIERQTKKIVEGEISQGGKVTTKTITL